MKVEKLIEELKKVKPGTDVNFCDADDDYMKTYPIIAVSIHDDGVIEENGVGASLMGPWHPEEDEKQSLCRVKGCGGDLDPRSALAENPNVGFCTKHYELLDSLVLEDGWTVAHWMYAPKQK